MLFWWFFGWFWWFFNGFSRGFKGVWVFYQHPRGVRLTTEGLSWWFLSIQKPPISIPLEGPGNELFLFFLSLGIQIPSKKVFNLLKTPQTTFSEGSWIPRV